MAAAIIPIASAVVALLPEIPKIVQAVEGLFGAGTGKTKLEVATSMANVAAQQLATAGKIQGVPDQAALASMVETVVQQLKATGQLPGLPSVQDVGAFSVTINGVLITAAVVK